MKIFVFGEINDSIIHKLLPSAKILSKRTLSGYNACCSKSGRAFLISGDGTVDGTIIECNAADLWMLDSWKGPLSLCKKQIVNEDFYSYFRIYEHSKYEQYNYADESTVLEFIAQNNHNSLNMADVHLLVPGYIEEMPSNVSENYFGNLLNEYISQSNNAEYNSDFLKLCKRYALGKVEIVLGDGTYQSAALTVMTHTPTNICVVDIFIPAISINTHRMLAQYCGDNLKVKYKGIEDSITSICKSLKITRFGSKRSLVFSYEKLTEEKMINLLANEETPMGQIMGSHFKQLISNNLAQYDTAEVYVSETTMLEMTDKVENDILLRIQSQAIEIFFVEMLLMQDAAVSRMNNRVKEEIELERATPFRSNSDKIIYELLDETAYTLCFMDYKQFYYPTVRISAESVAKAFGMNDIYKRYEQNKDLLEHMIQSHIAQIDKKENSIKNTLLFILTFLSGISTIRSAIDLMTNDQLGAYSYYLSATIMAVGIIAYWAIRAILIRRTKYNSQRKKK